jgi:hypothetical protein
MRFEVFVLAIVCAVPVGAVAQHGGGGGGGGMRGGGGMNRDTTKKPPKPAPPLSPYTEPNTKYPLKVKLLEANSNRSVEGDVAITQTVGAGNLIGEKTVGFDFKSTCAGGLTATTGGDSFYQAKWKKEDKKMELLTLVQGKTKSSTCSIEVSMKDKPYASGSAQ